MSLLALSLPPAPARGKTERDFCPVVVGKALLNPPPTRQINASQKALASFLARKHERFRARRKQGLEGQLGGGSSLDVSLEENNGALSGNDGATWNKSAVWNGSATFLREEKDAVQERCAFQMASVDLHQNQPQRTRKTHKLNPDDLIKLNCEELAEKVVSRVKTRLRHCSRRRRSGADVLRNHADKPISEVVDIVRSSTPVPSLSNTSTPLSLSPLKKEHTRPSNSSLNRSFEEPSSLSTSGLRVAKKVICFSEKQSATCKDTGIPNVPPSTPRTGTTPIIELMVLTCLLQFYRMVSNMYCHYQISR